MLPCKDLIAVYRYGAWVEEICPHLPHPLPEPDRRFWRKEDKLWRKKDGRSFQDSMIMKCRIEAEFGESATKGRAPGALMLTAT